MKQLLLLLSLLLLSFNGLAQSFRKSTINPQVDKSSIEFKQIYEFWENYLDLLSNSSIKQKCSIKKMDSKLKSYWDGSDTTTYVLPDLIYVFKNSFGSVFYPMSNEIFLGINKRDTNLYEIKTMFYEIEDSIMLPTLIISQPIIKKNFSYKLVNAFTLYKNSLDSKNVGNITYYFPKDYQFNDSLANRLLKEINEFKITFSISNDYPIKYFIGSSMTEIASWFGIDYFESDYNCSMDIIEGRASKNANYIYSAQGGENYFHEIIHILVKDFSKGNYNLFNEGVACYFGGHLGKPYSSYIPILKEFLNENQWIDLSKGLTGYENNNNIKISCVSNNSSSFHYYHDTTAHVNINYLIHALICDIIYNTSNGNLKVKKLLESNITDENDFFNFLEEIAFIKRKDLNSVVRKYIYKIN